MTEEEQLQLIEVGKTAIIQLISNKLLDFEMKIRYIDEEHTISWETSGTYILFKIIDPSTVNIELIDSTNMIQEYHEEIPITVMDDTIFNFLKRIGKL